MQNTYKVAKWEVKRNMKNKSFIIGLFLTPLIFLAFLIIPSLFSGSDPEPVEVYVNDELQLFDELETIVDQSDRTNWELSPATSKHEEMIHQVESGDNLAYVSLTEKAIESGTVDVYTSEEIDGQFMNEVHILEGPLRELQLQQLGLSGSEMDVISRGIAFNFHEDEADTEEEEFAGGLFLTDEEELMQRIVPGIFAGIILFSIVISGMMIFQSASQEKKDKIAEIILSSITPNELMQGKIVGYFVLGLIQVFVWLGIALPVIIWKVDQPIFEYLLVPELAILLLIAILGYLLFASLFVGLGATMEDVSTAGNFQGLVLMLPFLPFIFLGPLFTDPSGTVAKIGSFIPITSPAILIVRLSLLEDWPWVEIIIAIAILVVSVWLFMKLAGKIFRTGILLYGKNATPREIWKWLWA